MVTIDEVRLLALSLPRTTEAFVHGRVKFRIGKIVYLSFSGDETVMGFAFPKEERQMLVETEPDTFMLPSQSVRPLQLALSGNGLTATGPATTEIHGRDVATGLARTVHVDTEAVRQAIHAPLTAVLDGLGKVLRECPPDLVADLADCGIMMVGGSALLPGLDEMLREATGVPVRIADRPDVCSVLGLGAMLDGAIQPLVLGPIAD